MKNKTLSFLDLPVSLKVVFILLSLWILGSLSMISVRALEGLLFFGFNLYGITAVLVMSLFDVILPSIFLYLMLLRSHLALFVAYFFMGIFILNMIIVGFLYIKDLGVIAILIPFFVMGLIFYMVLVNRNYFIEK